MNESLTTDAASPASQPIKSSKFRLRNVLMVIVPAGIVALVVIAVAGLVDVDRLFSDLTRPALSPAKGRVLFQGQPVLNAEITTKPLNSRGKAALGWTDENGRFSLKTDIRGVLVEGVTVGEHRVTVVAYKVNSGAAAPTLLTPAQYGSMATSPLTITIQTRGNANEYLFVLEGEPPSSRPSSGGPARQPRPKAVSEKAEPEEPSQP